VNGMLALGIFTFLFVYPYQFDSRYKLIQLYTKYFFYSVIVVVSVQFGAIIIRINRYGFTEERYMVLMTAVWVLSLIVYFLLFRKKQLLFIPFTMFIAVAISTVGPFSAFNISKWSQKNRIEKLLMVTKMLNGNKIVPYTKDSTKNNLWVRTNANELVSEIRYMVREYDITGAEPWIKIKSKKDIMNDINKNLGEQRFSDRYEIQQIQNDSLTHIFKRLNLVDENGNDFLSVNTEPPVYNEDIAADTFEYSSPVVFNKMVSMKIPKGISKLTNIEINANYVESKKSNYSVQIKDKKYLQIFNSAKTYTFNLESLMSKENGDIITNYIFNSEEENGKYKFVLNEISFNKRKLQIESVEGILCE
jgi:hypothetical protein